MRFPATPNEDLVQDVTRTDNLHVGLRLAWPPEIGPPGLAP